MTRTVNDVNKKRRLSLESANTKAQLDRIYKRDKGICQICFKFCPRVNASRDHIKELRYCTREEARNDDNIRLSHTECNNKRSNTPPSRSQLTQSLADFMPAVLLKLMDAQNLSHESD